MTSEELKRYFLDAYELEKAKYATETVIKESDIAYKPDLFDHSPLSYDAEEVAKKEKRFKIGKRMLIAAGLCVLFEFAYMILTAIVGKELKLNFILVLPMLFTPIGLYVGAPLCFFNRKYKAMKKELEEVKERNEFIDEVNADSIEDAKKKQAITKNTVAQLHGVLAKIEQKRFQLYSDNVIHPKYRNLIAVSTILGYLDTKRCSELEGPDGAYNLFEDESRKDTIIHQLDQVNAKLDQIITNQYYLYSAITSLESAINSTTRAINENTEKLDQVATNTAVLAFEGQLSNVLQMENKYNTY